MASNRLRFGVIAGLLFFAGTFAIGFITPGYSHVRQTVSELGEVGSPGRVALSVLLCLVAACLIVFASAVARSLRESGHTPLPAYFVGAMAISAAGVGVFAYPQPLHNIFGMSETIGLQAPLVVALVYRMIPRGRQVVVFSIIMYVVVLAAIAINTMALIRPAGVWIYIKPFFGIVQRFLFASWFIWCAGYALLMIRIEQVKLLSKADL